MLWEERVGIDGWDLMEVCQNIEDMLRNYYLPRTNNSSEIIFTEIRKLSDILYYSYYKGNIEEEKLYNFICNLRIMHKL